MTFDIKTFVELHKFMFCHFKLWITCYGSYKIYDSEDIQLMDSEMSTFMCDVSFWGVWDGYPIFVGCDLLVQNIMIILASKEIIKILLCKGSQESSYKRFSCIMRMLIYFF